MRSCVICSEKAKGSNFGAVSCKACGEFFRRSVVGHRKYQCKGNGNCLIDISVRRPCPQCRFKKCLEKGMQTSGVTISKQELKSLEWSQEEENRPSWSEETHLEKVWANYQELIGIRIETEKRLDPEGYKTAEKDGMLKGMYHGTPKIWNLITRAHTPSVVEFVSKSIEGYHNLTKEERDLLLRSFLVYFWWTEGIFRVYKRAPKELYTSLFLVSDTSYMDISRQEMLLQDEEMPPFLVNDLMSLLKKEMKPDRQRSAFLMHDMRLRDYEFAALSELLFWNNTVEGCSDELHKKIHAGRARAMESLEKCYEKYKEPEPLVRMGEILNIQSAIFIEIFRCREDMESFKIYDAFESFDFLYKLTRTEITVVDMEHKHDERGRRTATIFVSVQTTGCYRSPSYPRQSIPPLFSAIFEMSEQPSTSRICLVCCDITFGGHFGIDACRGCAAFFRRTIIERKVYACRTGGGCRIDKNQKPMCRKCRLKKCLDKGMQPSGVQAKQDEVYQITDDPNPISVTQSNGQGSKMFEKLLQNYQELRAVRKATERALDPETYKTVETSGPLAGYACGKQENWLLFFRAHTPSVIEFAANSIEGFNDLEEQDRLKLLKPFLVYFFWIDTGYRTYKLLPRDDINWRCLISETTYIDAEQTHIMFDLQNMPNYLVNDVNKLLSKEMCGDRQRSLYMAYDMKLLDEEFAALVGLLFWNTTVEQCSESVHQFIRKQRAKIYEELGKLYQRIQEPAPFVRMGELMNIQNAVLVESIRCREDLEVYKIFEAFEKFDSFYEMVRDAH